MPSYPPPYENIMKLNPFHDSMRLPPYQTRELRRYHPYIRLISAPQLEGPSNGFTNTVYDEEITELDVAPHISHIRDDQQALFAVLAMQPPLGIELPLNANQGDQELLARILRLGVTIFDFLSAVRHAVEARVVARHVVVPPAEPEPE